MSSRGWQPDPLICYMTWALLPSYLWLLQISWRQRQSRSHVVGQTGRCSHSYIFSAII